MILSLRFLAIVLITVIYNAIATCAPGYTPVLFATTQNPITGRMAGKYGPAVFTTWKGLNVMKTKPETVRNPQTIKQVDQREKFTLIQNFASACLALVKVGYRDLAIHMSEFNACIADNLPDAIEGTSGSWARDYSELKLSQGTLVNQVGASITFLAQGTFAIDWTDNDGTGNALTTDEAYVLALIEGSDLATKVKYVLGAVTRSSEQAAPVIPVDWVGETVHCYIFFRSADGAIISDTEYVGTGTITA